MVVKITNQAVLDKPPSSCLVEDHGALLRFAFQRLDLVEVLPHARKLPINRVLLRIHAPESQIS